MYGGTPPDIVTVAEPVFPPLQTILTCNKVEAKTGGCVMVTVCVTTQPPTPVQVTLYVPTDKPVAV